MTADELNALNDKALTQRVVEGDTGALEILLERHAPKAIRIAASVLRNDDDALDAAQTALIQVSQSMRSVWAGGSFEAWVCSCAHKAAVNLMRQNANRRRREQAVVLQNAQKEPLMAMETMLEKREILAALHEEMSMMTERTTAALMLHHVEDLPIAEVAGQTGLSIDACKQRLSRGREELRERLQRRGVALASVALLTAALDELATPARACTAKLSQPIYSSMARKVTLLATAAGAMSASSNSFLDSADTAINAGHSSFASCGDVGPLERFQEMYKKNLIVGNCCIVLSAAITVFLIAGGKNGSVLAARMPQVANRVALHDPKPEPNPKGDQEGKPETPDVAPRWQEPRFIQGGMFPLSLSAEGNHAALLTVKTDEAKGSIGLALKESHDGGQSWYNQHTFNALESDATFVVLGGSSESTHIAIHVLNRSKKELGTGIDDSVLVIRSFTIGEWKSSGQTPPAWFNEMKLPAPTKEEF